MKKASVLGLGLAFLAGCGFMENGKTSVEFGVVNRQVRGSYKNFEVDRMIPAARLRVNREVGEDVDFYLRGDFVRGEVGAEHDFCAGGARGSFGALGAGIDYAPFSDYWGFDFGCEVFQADFDMRGRFGGIGDVEKDSVWGVGANIGLFGEIPIDKNVSLIGRAGWNFTENWSRKCDADFNGAYGFFGVKIGFGD